MNARVNYYLRIINLRRIVIDLSLLFATLILISFAWPSLALAKTYNQSGYALQSYNYLDFKAIKNKNYGKKTISTYNVYPRNETQPHKVTKAKGNKSVTFSTFAYLPKSYNSSGDMGNPQSICVSPNGQYAWVSYPTPGSSEYGYIIRYDLHALSKLGINRPGETMNLLHGAAHKHFAGRPLTDQEQDALNCMTIGPTFKMGHGCAIAYNPKDKHIWFCSKTKKMKTDLQRINMDTLKPDTCINFNMSKTVNMGMNLTFDKEGNCYFFAYSGDSWKNAPKGTIKIYQGTINLKAKKKKVTFKLFMQGIRYALSNNIQSMGYNIKRDRLYLVSDSAIMSIPRKKLVNGKLSKSDIHSTIFTDSREYEGLAFDKTGRAYLLVNKQPEIMCATSGF